MDSWNFTCRFRVDYNVTVACDFSTWSTKTPMRGIPGHLLQGIGLKKISGCKKKVIIAAVLKFFDDFINQDDQVADNGYTWRPGDHLRGIGTNYFKIILATLLKAFYNFLDTDNQVADDGYTWRSSKSSKQNFRNSTKVHKYWQGKKIYFDNWKYLKINNE